VPNNIDQERRRGEESRQERTGKREKGKKLIESTPGVEGTRAKKIRASPKRFELSLPKGIHFARNSRHTWGKSETLSDEN
jgi:hypothetical protein